MTEQVEIRGMKGTSRCMTLDLRRGYEAPFPPSQVNDSNKGSNGPQYSMAGEVRHGIMGSD